MTEYFKNSNGRFYYMVSNNYVIELEVNLIGLNIVELSIFRKDSRYIDTASKIEKIEFNQMLNKVLEVSQNGFEIQICSYDRNSKDGKVLFARHIIEVALGIIKNHNDINKAKKAIKRQRMLVVGFHGKLQVGLIGYRWIFPLPYLKWKHLPLSELSKP